MIGWRVTYGLPFPGWREFSDVHRALEFAETAHAENPTITTTPETLRQLLAHTWDEGYGDDITCNEPRDNPHRQLLDSTEEQK